MKAYYGILVMALLVLAVVPMVLAVDVGTGIGIDITTEEFPPHIWMCDQRVVLEDCIEEGRITDCSLLPGPGGWLWERLENYAFEGEQIHWTVLAMDKNKIEEIQEVVGTIGETQGEGNDIEVQCQRVDGPPVIPPSCNARLDEERLVTFDEDTMAYYDCLFTVETPDSMHGEYFITVEAISVDGSATMDENEYWFLNPEIALSVDGDLTFDDVRPGTVAYSDTLLVGNDAEEGSGVLLDMFISGTDFYDPASSGAKCPTSNRLKLSLNLRDVGNLGHELDDGPSFTTDCDIDTWLALGDGSTDNHDHLCYFATNGAYSTQLNTNSDAEGYKPIAYGNSFTRDFYNDAEIIAGVPLVGPYWAGNVLTPGAEIALTFKLGMPEPCVGDFSAGQIFFWGEAI